MLTGQTQMLPRRDETLVTELSGGQRQRVVSVLTKSLLEPS